MNTCHPTLRRQINDEEKCQILQQHGRKCYATGHDIPENENVQFDHIHAFSTGGESEINNIAPMCERHNTISLCNIIDEEILHLYDPEKTENDTTQNQLNRMFRSKSIMAWSELLRDAIAGKLDISDQDDRVRLFYRVLSEEQLGQIKLIVRRLVAWSLWKSPVGSEIDRVLSDNKSEVKAFFKNKGLTTGYLMGAKE